MKKILILVLLSAFGISAHEVLSETELIDRAVQSCYAKYTRHLKYDEPINEADERLCQIIFDLVQVHAKNKQN